MRDHSADGLLVVGQGAHGLAGGEVPQADGLVVAAGDNLCKGDRNGNRILKKILG